MNLTTYADSSLLLICVTTSLPVAADVLGIQSSICVVSLQPSLLAMALLCYEAQEQHDPEHVDNVSEALKSLQQQLNVSRHLKQMHSVI